MRLWLTASGTPLIRESLERASQTIGVGAREPCGWNLNGKEVPRSADLIPVEFRSGGRAGVAGRTGGCGALADQEVWAEAFQAFAPVATAVYKRPKGIRPQWCKWRKRKFGRIDRREDA